MSFTQRRLPLCTTTGFSLLLACGLALGPGASTAAAYDVVPDPEAGVCRVDPRQKDSPVTEFWTSLREDAVAQRLDEMDAADPGLRQAIEDYDLDRPGAATPGELQERIAATGTTEGLGMFIPHRTQAEDGIGDQAGDKTEYSPEAARAAARAIGDSPSNAPQDALDKQAATSGLRLDQITADLFRERHAAYDATQKQLQQSLLDCADAVDEANKPPLFATGAGVAVIVAAVVAAVIGLRVVVNRRRPNRHHAPS